MTRTRKSRHRILTDTVATSASYLAASENGEQRHALFVSEHNCSSSLWKVAEHLFVRLVAKEIQRCRQQRVRNKSFEKGREGRLELSQP